MKRLVIMVSGEREGHVAKWVVREIMRGSVFLRLSFVLRFLERETEGVCTYLSLGVL